MYLSWVTIIVGILVVAAVSIITGMYILRNNIKNKVLNEYLNKGAELKDQVIESVKKAK